jgi:fibronectin-binding autotransporter adhesin
MKGRLQRRAIARSTARKLELACRSWPLAVPLGGLLMAQGAWGQSVYHPTLSDIQITHTAGVGAAGSITNGPNFMTVNVPGVLGAPPAGEIESAYPILTTSLLTATYQLVNTFTQSNISLGPPSSSAYASVGETNTANAVEVALGTGTGVTQTNPGGLYPYASELNINVNTLSFFVTAPFPQNHSPQLGWSFGVGGTLPAGGSADLEVSLKFYYYKTTNQTNFSFSSETPTLLSTLTLNEPFTNSSPTNTLVFSNLSTPSLNTGSVQIAGNQALLSSGYIDIVGSISLIASVDSPPGGSPGVGQGSTSGGSWTPAPSSFEMYLPQVSMVSTGQSAGNTFNSSGNTDLTQSSGWTDITGGNSPLVPGTNDIAQFAGNIVNKSQTFNLNAATTWAGVSVVNPGGAVNIAPGAGGSLTLGALGVGISADTNGLSQSLTISAPVALSSSQTWDVIGGQALTFSGSTLALGGNRVNVQDAGNVAISANVSDGGAGGLIMNGTGTLFLSGANSFSGPGLLLNSGEVSVASDANLGGPASAIMFNGGILQILGNTLTSLNSHTVNWNSFTGGFDIASASNTITLGAAQSIGNAAVNAGSLTKMGAGTLVLAGVNTYFGPTTINGGLLEVTANNTLNTASTIDVNSAQGLGIGDMVVVDNPIQLNLSGGEFLAPAQQQIVLGGSITTGTNPADQYNLGSPNGSISILGANVVGVGQQAAISEGTISFLNTGSLAVNPSGTLGLVLGGAGTPVILSLNNSSSITNFGSNGATMAGNLAGQPDVSLAVNDQASLNLGAGILNADNGNAANVNNTLQLSGGVVTVGGIGFSGSASGTVGINFNGGVLAAGASNANFLPQSNVTMTINGAAIIDTNGFSDTINSPNGFTNGAVGGGLTKNGAGFLILGPNFGQATASNYNGVTTVNGGLLEWNEPNQLGNTSKIQVNSGGAAGDDAAGAAALSQFVADLSTTSTGGLALSTFLAGENFDYTGTVSGAFPMNEYPNMSIGAVSGGIAYANTITPAQNTSTGLTTYQLGGGGVLKLVAVTGGNNAGTGVPLVDAGTTTNLLVENGGTVWLATTNTYSGTTTIQGTEVVTIPAADSLTGADQTQLEQTTLEVSSLSGAGSSLGTSAPSAANLVINGGVLDYVGTGGGTLRLFTIGQLGATIDASGATGLDFVNTGTEAFSPGVTGPVTLTLGGTNTLGNVLSAFLVNPAGGTLSVVKSGAGEWSLTGSNTYGGGTYLDGGTLEIASNNNIGGANSAITFNGGILSLQSTPITNLDSHTVNWSTFNGGLDLASNALAFTINENIGGTGSLTLQGLGTLILGGTSNTYSGGTNIDGGTLIVSSLSQLGSGPIVDNAELTLNLAAPQTYSGGIAGTGNVFVEPNGTLTLNGANTLTGQMGLGTGATLVLDYSTAANPSVPILSSNSSLSMGGSTLQINPNGTMAVSQSFTSTSIGAGGPSAIIINTTTLAAVNLNLGSLSFLTNSLDDAVQFSSPVSGTVSSIQVNTGNNTAALVAAVSNGQYSGYATFGTSDWAATTANVGGSAYIVPGSAIAGFYTPLFNTTAYTATANLDVVGTGQQLLLESPAFASLRFNTPNGGLFNDGTNNVDQVYLAGEVNVGAFLVTPNVGANNVLITPNNSGNNQNTQDIALTSGNAVFWQNNTAGMLVVNTGISSAGGLTKEGPGVMALNATSTYSGSTNIEGGILEVPYDAALGSSEFVELFGGTLMAVQSMTTSRSPEVAMSGGGLIAAHGQTLTLTSSILGSSPLSVGSSNILSTATVNSATGNAVTFANTAGDGTVIFAASNSGFDGPLFVNGGQLLLQNAGGLGNTTAVTVAAGATLNLNGYSEAIPSIAGGGVITGGAATLTINGSASTTFSGQIEDGIGTMVLVQSGTGTLTLSGSNTYSGATDLVSGEVSIGSAANISNTINFEGGVLQVTGSTYHNLNGKTINGATFSGGVDVADAVNTVLISQNISGNGSLLKLGPGTLGLTGSNTFTGGTTISAGAIVVSGLSALGNGPVTDNGTLIIDNQGTQTLTTSLSGGGGLMDNSADLILSGNSNFAGTTTVPSGMALTLASSTALGTGAQVVNNGSFLVDANSSIGGVSGTGTTTVAPSNTFYASGLTQGLLVNNGTATIGCGGVVGLISGSGGLTVGTNAMIGQLQLGSGSGTSQQGSLTIYTGSELDLNGNSFVTGALWGGGTIDDVSAGGSVSVKVNGGGSSTFSGTIQNTTGTVTLKLSAGTLDLNGVNSYSGGTSINGGNLVIGSSGGLPAGGAVVNSSALTILAGTSASPVTAGNVSGSGALIVGNSSGTAGYLMLQPGSHTSTLASLTVNSGSTLDISNNTLLVNFGAGPDPAAAIKAALAAGYKSGSWTGTAGAVGAIVSSTAAAGVPGGPILSVGYGDGNVDTGAGTTTQTPATAGQVLIKFTLAGDAFLNGTVNFNDLDVIGKRLNTSGNDWASGNFNYDPNGAVNFNDLTIVGQNLNKTLGTLGSSMVSTGGTTTTTLGEIALVQNTSVPEPSFVGLGILGGALLARKKKRKNIRWSPIVNG